MKLFEIREYDDGGPNDRGAVIGYVRASSREELRAKRTHSFIDYFEISEESLQKEVERLEKKLKLIQSVL